MRLISISGIRLILSLLMVAVMATGTTVFTHTPAFSSTPGTFSVSVKEGSSPLEGIVVKACYSSNTNYECVDSSASSGPEAQSIYSIPSLPSDFTGYINLSAGGHPSEFSEAFAYAYIVNGELSQPTEIILERTEWVEITVSVKDNSDRVLPGKQIYLTMPEVGWRAWSDITDADGETTLILDKKIWDKDGSQITANIDESPGLHGAASQVVAIDLATNKGSAQLIVDQTYVPDVYTFTVRDNFGVVIKGLPVRSYYECPNGSWEDCGETVSTDENGVATFTNVNLPNSTGYISFSAGGHLTQYSLGWSGAYVVKGVPQWLPQTMVLQETTWLEVEITVMDTGKTPNRVVANAGVIISTPESWGNRTEWATTNTSGIATFNLDANAWGGSKVVTAEMGSWSGYQRAEELVEFSGSTGSATINTRSVSYTLSGTVTDPDGEKPYASKQMCLGYYDGSRYKQVDISTNSLGYYSLEGITGSWVHFRPSSCNSWDGNGYDYAYFSYSNDATTDPVHNFQFTRTGIELTVTDQNGQPAAFLPVQLNGGSQYSPWSTTDQFGVAFFSNLNIGTSYTPFYKRQQYDSNPLRFEETEGSQSYTVGEVNTITRATLQLTKLPSAVETPVTISGKLVTVSGSPVVDGLVTLSVWNYSHSMYNSIFTHTRSDSNGEFSIENLPHGQVHLSIQPSGFRTVSWNLETSPAKGVKYDLGNFQLRSALNGNYTYSGVLQNTKGEPIPDFELTMNPPWGSGQDAKTATTNSLGAFTFEGLTSGWHGLSANNWYEGYESKYWSINLTTTTLNATHTIVEREVAQNGSASISGRVLEYLDVNGPGSAIPVAEACIGAWPTDGGMHFSTSTDDTGNWSISGLVEGQEYNYYLASSCAGNQETLNRFDFENKYEHPGYNQKIIAEANGGTPEEIFLVEVSRTGSGSISGRVKDSVDYSNVAGIPVSIWRSRGGIVIEPVSTDNRGEYSFENLPAGDYYLQIGEYSDDSSALYEVAWFSVEVGSGDNRVNAILNKLPSGDQAGQISGQVYDEFGMGHGSAYVHIIGTDSYSWFGSAITDNDGKFEVDGLPVGVSLQVQVVPHWNELAVFFSQFMIAAGGTSVSLDPVNLAESATISGSVAGLPVTANGFGNTLFVELIDKTTKRAVMTTWVDRNTGTYGFEQVPQGTFLVRYSQNPAEYMGYSDFSQPGGDPTSVKPVYWNRTQFGTSDEFAASELQIEPGDTRRAINVTISPGSSIKGELSVATPDGASPLSGTRQVVVIAHMKKSNGTWVPVTRSYVSGENNSTFFVAGLADGRYKLEFQDFKRGNNSLVTSYNGGFSSLEAAPEIVVGEGQLVISNHAMTIAPPEKSAEAFDLDELSAQVLAQLKGEIVLGADAASGSDLEIFVGTEFSGEFVSAFANSTPAVLGDWKQVDSRGFITVRIPRSLPAGSHRIAVQDSRSTVFGWAPITLKCPKASAPDAPTKLVVSKIKSKSFSLAWAPPACNGGRNITNFSVEVSTDNGTTWRSVKPKASTSRSYTVPDATPGTRHLVRIAAINAEGHSEYLTDEVTTPATVPTAPNSLVVSNPATTGLTLSWIAPSYDGGAAISDYKVEYAVGTSNKWTAIKITSSTSSLDVTSLRPNQVYRFRVSATNNAGTGAVSKIVSGTTLVDLPQAPTNLTASKVTSTGSSLAWRAPINTGGARITDYDLETSRDNGANWIKVTKKTSNSTRFALTGLDPVTTYLFRVSAVNSKGAGAAVTGSFTTLAAPPGAPTNLRPTDLTGTTATIAWDAPAADGGSEITNYRVEFSSNCKNYKTLSRAASDSSTHNINSLKPGFKYCFRVSAINARGTSPSSTVLELITVGNPPNAPTALKFTAKATQVTLSWAAATVTGGGPVRDYLVEYSSDAGLTWIKATKPVSTSHSLTIRNLTRSTVYIFRVYATNDSGTSPASNNHEVTTPAK